MENQKRLANIKYLAGQHGGNFPVFRGSRQYQYGSGFGDVLKGIFRRVLPIALEGAATFFTAASQAKNRGLSIREAAKEALKPTAESVISGAAKAINQKIEERRAKKEEEERRRTEPSEESQKWTDAAEGRGNSHTGKGSRKRKHKNSRHKGKSYKRFKKSNSKSLSKLKKAFFDPKVNYNF